jgi:hypothetical protein
VLGCVSIGGRALPSRFEERSWLREWHFSDDESAVSAGRPSDASASAPFHPVAAWNRCAPSRYRNELVAYVEQSVSNRHLNPAMARQYVSRDGGHDWRHSTAFAGIPG